jgi:hypothetical protein
MQICEELYLCNCIVLLENLLRMSDVAIFYFDENKINKSHFYYYYLMSRFWFQEHF